MTYNAEYATSLYTVGNALLAGPDWEEILKRDHRICRDCGKGPLYGKHQQIHHLEPGVNTVGNQIVLCTSCHRLRHNGRHLDAPILCIHCGGDVHKNGKRGRRQLYWCRACKRVMALGPLLA